MQVYTTEVALLNIVNLGSSLLYKIPSSSNETTLPFSYLGQQVYQVSSSC